MDYKTEYSQVKVFLTAQLELHKIEYAATGNEKHLEAMEKFTDAIKFLANVNNMALKLNAENYKLKS